MTATNHGLLGAVIAITLQKYPAVAIGVAPFTHFALDAIPHFGGIDVHNKKFFRILFADATLAVASTLYIAYLYPHIWWLVIVCAFLAASPDLMWIYYEYVNKPLRYKHWLPRFHSWIQWSQTVPGIVVELLWFAILFPSLIVIGLS